MKSGAGIPFSLHFRAAFFLAAAMPEGPAPNPLGIGCSTTQAVALATIAAYCPATCGLGTPTHAVAPAKGSWSQASWPGGFATKSMAGTAACSGTSPGNGTRSQDPLTYGGEAKANRPSTASCSATALKRATGPLISTVPTGTRMSATAGTSLFPWPDTKGILKMKAQFPACPAGLKAHVIKCHQWPPCPPHCTVHVVGV